MYGFSEYINITKEEVLKRVNQEDVYELILGYRPQINKYIKSMFRSDNHPGAFFTWYNGVLYFKDFGDSNRQMRDCFQFVMEKKGLTFIQSLTFINEHFKLGLSGGIPLPVLQNNEFTSEGKAYLKKNKGFFNIEFKPRNFGIIDKKYFYDRYKITRNQLISDNIFPIIWYEFFSAKANKVILIRPAQDEVCYAICNYNDKKKVKIYRPMYKGDVGKWLTNSTENDIGGIDDITDDPLLIITKSYKDCRVLKNQGLNAIWFNNEGMMPSDELLIDMCATVKTVVIWFDNDEKGFLSAQKIKVKMHELMPHLRIETLHLPIRLNSIGIKDPSDLLYKSGQSDLTTFIKQNIWNQFLE